MLHLPADMWWIIMCVQLDGLGALRVALTSRMHLEIALVHPDFQVPLPAPPVPPTPRHLHSAMVERWGIRRRWEGWEHGGVRVCWLPLTAPTTALPGAHFGCVECGLWARVATASGPAWVEMDWCVCSPRSRHPLGRISDAELGVSSFAASSQDECPTYLHAGARAFARVCARVLVRACIPCLCGSV